MQVEVKEIFVHQSFSSVAISFNGDTVRCLRPCHEFTNYARFKDKTAYLKCNQLGYPGTGIVECGEHHTITMSELGGTAVARSGSLGRLELSGCEAGRER